MAVAIPSYLGTDFSTASPGQRFGMYLGIWNANWSKPQSIDSNTWRGITRLNDSDKKTMVAIQARMEKSFGSIPVNSGLQLAAIATAPFTTGLGNEHPLENGFAFLNPYGLPYLPGSGVKGVLRQAARELASGDWGDKQGWNDAAITALFGLESDKGDTEHLRGALTFWDVIPQIKGDSLTVEIMTPHQSHYYQNGQSPHDSGQPTPISFLTVPHGSGFTFHVVCDFPHLERIAPELAADDKWKTLLSSAFEHAFEWLGFGAKTAVGYGAMIGQLKAQKEAEEAFAESMAESGITVGAFTWDNAVLAERNPGAGTYTIRNTDTNELVTAKQSTHPLSDKAFKKLKDRKSVPLKVTVRQQGKLYELVSVQEIQPQ